MPHLHWSLLVVVAGVLKILLALISAATRRRFMGRSELAQGEITRIDADSSGEYPVVTFALHGRSYELKASQSEATGTYQIGQALPVRFDPADPAHATLETAREAHARAPEPRLRAEQQLHRLRRWIVREGYALAERWRARLPDATTRGPLEDRPRRRE